MGNINVNIPEDVHNLLRHRRVETKEDNNIIMTAALRLYFSQMGTNYDKYLASSTPQPAEQPVEEVVENVEKEE